MNYSYLVSFDWKSKFHVQYSFKRPDYDYFEFKVIDEEKKELACFILNEVAIDYDLQVPRSIKIEENDTDGIEPGTYTVVYVHLKCWYQNDGFRNVCFLIPDTVRDVFIDRDKEDGYPYKGFISSHHARFWVDYYNPHLTSDNSGSLYSKDKSELIHYYIGEHADVVEIPSHVTKIRRNALYGCSGKIIFPESITSITEQYIDRFGEKTVFKGKVTSISDNAFDDLWRMPKILCINNQMENISLSESIIERYGGKEGWDYSFRTNPVAKFTEVGQDYIQLSKTIPNDQAVLLHTDTVPLFIKIDPRSSEPLVCQEKDNGIEIQCDSNTIIFAYPVYIEDIYEPRLGTQIRIQPTYDNRDGISYTVYEEYETVKEMIQKVIGRQ